MPRVERPVLPPDRARIGVETHCRPDRLAGVPLASGTPVAAVDQPCHVGSLEDVERDRARSDCRAAAMAADLQPVPVRDVSHAAVPGEPGGGRDWCQLASRSDKRDSANADLLAQPEFAVAAGRAGPACDWAWQ
jgi:hypothetical protein